LRTLRLELRGIMKYQQQSTTTGRVAPQVFDIDDGDFVRADYTPSSKGWTLVEYKLRVESVLQTHFAREPTMQRIRARPAGQRAGARRAGRWSCRSTTRPTSSTCGARQADAQVAAHRLPQPGGPWTPRRSIAPFHDFVHTHPRLSSQQLRFLQVLQNHIAQHGGIELERLYEPPFTTLHAESVDGIFPNEVDELFGHPAPRVRSPPIYRADRLMSTLSTQQKSDIDRLWTEFWTGGITNPLTVIEQISFLMFARLLDVTETRNEKKAERPRSP
jgi:type I restriction enzyme R subunit